MARSISLTVIDDGPIKVSGSDVSVRYCGKPVETEPGKDVFLCRCGESSNPPFCDGSHAKTGFVAEPAEGATKDVHVWEGRKLRTYFNPNTCMHVFYCKPLKELRKRELEGDDAAASEIARVVQSCPSGALTYEAKESVPAPTVVDGADIDVMEGGEVRVQCQFDINKDLQERQDPTRATLCRCGLSKNKPWCDGRHKQREGFR